jgi:N-methylhydantoinase B
MDAVDTLYANTRNNPIEDIESHLPLRVARYELREGASGADEWRGGLGSVREFVYLSDGSASVEGEGHEFAPWGFAGGKPGSPAEVAAYPARRERRGASVESSTYANPRERAVRLCRPGRGGYGNPLARTRERVRDDVADGLLSAEGAPRDYAVALTSPGSVDEEETARLRAMDAPLIAAVAHARATLTVC